MDNRRQPAKDSAGDFFIDKPYYIDEEWNLPAGTFAERSGQELESAGISTAILAGEPAIGSDLASFLPNLIGPVNTPASTDGSGLMQLLEKPPAGGLEIEPFPIAKLERALRLKPGALPAAYLELFQPASDAAAAATATAAESASVQSSRSTKRESEGSRDGRASRLHQAPSPSPSPPPPPPPPPEDEPRQREEMRVKQARNKRSRKGKMESAVELTIANIKASSNHPPASSRIAPPPPQTQPQPPKKRRRQETPLSRPP